MPTRPGLAFAVRTQRILAKTPWGWLAPGLCLTLLGFARPDRIRPPHLKTTTNSECRGMKIYGHISSEFPNMGLWPELSTTRNRSTLPATKERGWVGKKAG